VNRIFRFIAPAPSSKNDRTLLYRYLSPGRTEYPENKRSETKHGRRFRVARTRYSKRKETRKNYVPYRVRVRAYIRSRQKRERGDDFCSAIKKVRRIIERVYL